MYLSLLYIGLVFILAIGELLILIWFFARLRDLKRGKTDFRINWWIPIFYLGVMIPVALNGYRLFLDFGLYGTGSGIPREFGHSEMLGMYVRSTLVMGVFPLLAWLRHRKGKTIQ